MSACRPPEKVEWWVGVAVLEIEGLYRASQQRRLSNSEIHELGEISKALAGVAQRELSAGRRLQLPARLTEV